MLEMSLGIDTHALLSGARLVCLMAKYVRTSIYSSVRLWTNWGVLRFEFVFDIKKSPSSGKHNFNLNVVNKQKCAPGQLAWLGEQNSLHLRLMWV